MSEHSLSMQRSGRVFGRLSDYFALTKPAVVALLLLTTLCGMIVAAAGVPLASIIVLTLLGGALTAGGAGALNQYIDRGVDRKMVRTRRRPLPDDRLPPRAGMIFGFGLSIAGLIILAVGVNLLSAVLALLGLVYYVIFYSLLLKHTTPSNIVIGGGAGAIPPLVGWAAVTGSLSPPAFYLFALIFFWTPPHFWALALLKKNDYARAQIPMMPVVRGARETQSQILLYSILVVAFSLLMPLVGLGGLLYLVVASVLGAGLVQHALKLRKRGENRFAWRMYKYSNLYLVGILVTLMAEALLSG